MAVAQHACGTDQPSVAAALHDGSPGSGDSASGTPGHRTRSVASRCWARRSAPIDRRSSGTAPANGFGFRGRGGLTAVVAQ